MGGPVEAVGAVGNTKGSSVNGAADPEEIPAEECGQMAEYNGTSMSEEEFNALLKSHPAWKNFMLRGADGMIRVDESIMDWVSKEGKKKSENKDTADIGG